MYCEYGLAFPIASKQYAANCTQVDKVFFNDQEIFSPYKCDPTDNEKRCKLQYNTTIWDGTRPA